MSKQAGLYFPNNEDRDRIPGGEVLKMNAKEKSNKVDVRILNDHYVIKGNAEKAYIEKVAAYVDLKMKQLTLKNPYLSPLKIAVLAAVNITDELFRLQDDYDE